MGRTLVLSLAAVAAVAATVGAQGSAARSTAADSVFHRAIALVDDGEGAAGRALLDSMVLNTRAGSLEHAEALYWRATVAPTGTDAERDYRSILLDHPVSPRIPDVLLRLAQLDLTRGHRAGALVLLQRLELEYPNAPNRARTSYWMARAFLDENDVARGCARVSEARSRLSRTDVELRNQIDFLALRCPTAVAAAPATTSPSTAPPPPPRTQPPPMPVVAPPRDTSELVARDTRPSVPRETIPVSPRPTTAAPPPAVSTPVPTPPGTPVGTAVTPAPAPPLGGWSVQVAAYSTRPPADELVQRLRTRGIDARIDGNEFPYRVRVGRYPSRVAASAALRDLQSKGVEGFIVRAGT
jgi:cell division septation protein DedD